jgi:hypothetical protein
MAHAVVPGRPAVAPILRGIDRERIQEVPRIESWFHDFFGPGGVMKGLAYLEQPPAPGLLVESIDNSTAPITPDEKELFRGIEGRWYLFAEHRA